MQRGYTICVPGGVCVCVPSVECSAPARWMMMMMMMMMMCVGVSVCVCVPSVECSAPARWIGLPGLIDVNVVSWLRVYVCTDMGRIRED